MDGSRPRRILFSGYAPVHVLCCLPVYQRLSGDPRIEFWLSGGFKRIDEEEEDTVYDLNGFYDAFPVDRRRVIPIERAREEDFDVLVSAHGSASLFPRSARQTVQIFHGVSFKNLLVREKYLQYHHLCLPGRYHAELYRRKGLVRPGVGQCLVTGFPKADPLVSGTPDRDALRRRYGVDPGRPTILYAPTGSRQNSLETMGLDVIRRIRDDGRWNLLIKLHDHPKSSGTDWIQALGTVENDRVRRVRDWDVVPCLQAADLLITDASSVSVEFSLLDRPILFLDVPELLEKVVKRDGALDLDTYGRKVGVVVKRPEDVVDAVGDALAHPRRERELRRAMARHVFHDPGRATERVAGVVLHAAGLLPALPDGVEVLAPDPAPPKGDE
jgi:hypothetical protein